MSPRAGRAPEVERECALWPAAQAARWRAACAGAEPASWRPATRRSRAYVWSLYLAHCRAAGLSPSLTAEGVTGFAKVCAGRGVSGRTFATYGGALAAVAQVVEPGNPVIVALERRNRQAVPLARRAPKRKHATLLRAGSADALFAAACRELDALWPELAAVPAARLTALLPERPRLRAALVRCRGALTVALLLACPDRRSACSQLTLASLGPGLATIVYPGETTKPERDNRQPIPAELRPHLTRWLELREAVATGHDRLWVSFTRARVGAPAAPDTHALPRRRRRHQAAARGAVVAASSARSCGDVRARGRTRAARAGVGDARSPERGHDADLHRPRDRYGGDPAGAGGDRGGGGGRRAQGPGLGAGAVACGTGTGLPQAAAAHDALMACDPERPGPLLQRAAAPFGMARPNGAASSRRLAISRVRHCRGSRRSTPARPGRRPAGRPRP
jgi:hypothetical protein